MSTNWIDERCRGDASRHCYNRSEPVFQEGYWSVANKSQMSIAESTIKKLERRGVKVEYLRITQMSEQRRDAHPSIYRKFYAPITEENRKHPMSYSDCLHWCLPGVPDVWNQILYAYIINSWLFCFLFWKTVFCMRCKDFCFTTYGSISLVLLMSCKFQDIILKSNLQY